MPLITAGTITYGTSNISQVYKGRDLIWPVEMPTSGDYLNFQILTGGTLTFKSDNGYIGDIDVMYSRNSGNTWNTQTVPWTHDPVSIHVSAGEVILLKAIDEVYHGTSKIAHLDMSGSTAYFNIRGNIMSLLYGDMFLRKNSLLVNAQFTSLFGGTNVVSAGDLILPSTRLKYYCYGYMFGSCKSLTIPPKLPATILASNCYMDMFSGCNSLLIAPELPATTLYDGCYESMFSGCYSLTTAPELKAARIADGAYKNMFYGCSRLNYIKCLATDVSGYECTYNWAKDVASDGTFVKAANMSSWTTGSDGIPSGWTIIDNQ